MKGQFKSEPSKHEKLRKVSHLVPHALMFLPCLFFVVVCFLAGYAFLRINKMSTYPDGLLSVVDAGDIATEFSYSTAAPVNVGYGLPLSKLPSNYETLPWGAVGGTPVYDDMVLLLRDGGFVRTVGYSDFGTAYANLKSENVPVVLTVDSIADHFNNASRSIFLGIETAGPIEQYEVFLNKVGEILATKYRFAENAEIKELLMDDGVYLYVAGKLLDDGLTVASFANEEGEVQLEKIIECGQNSDAEGCEEMPAYIQDNGYANSFAWLAQNTFKSDSRRWSQMMILLTSAVKYSIADAEWEIFYPFVKVDLGVSGFFEFSSIDAAVQTVWGYGFDDEQILDSESMARFEAEIGAESIEGEDIVTSDSRQVWSFESLTNDDAANSQTWQNREAWRNKITSTASAIDAQVNGFFVEDSVSMAGVAEGTAVPATIFLEPEPELYARMAYYWQTLATLVETAGGSNDAVLAEIDENVRILSELKSISAAIYAGTVLTPEQTQLLSDVYLTLEADTTYRKAYLAESGSSGFTGDIDLVALTQIGSDGQQVIAFGPVYSYYQVPADQASTITTNDALVSYASTSVGGLSPASLTVVNDNNFNDPYDFPVVEQAAGSVRIPVLMYHHIAPLPGDTTKRYYVSAEGFEQQVAWLIANNYHIMTPEEFAAQLQTGQNPAQKSVMLTFDDSPADNYYNAYPILKKYGVPGVFYVVSQRSGINAEQLKEMADNGMIIDSHAATHRDLRALDNSELWDEISGSKAGLQAITGYPIVSIAYPGCTVDGRGIDIAASSGYTIGFSCGSKIDHYWGSRFTLSRIHAYDDMDNFVKIFSGIWEFPPGYP